MTGLLIFIIYLCPVAIQTNFIEELFASIDVSFFEGAEALLPIPVQVLINLCGGIPAPYITNIRVHITATYATAFCVQIFTDQYEAVRNFDFSIGRIDNNHLYVENKRHGIGTNLFLNQLLTARWLGFKRIHLTAMAPSGDDELVWEGYHFWAKLGFENADVDDYLVWAAEMEELNQRSVNLCKRRKGARAGKKQDLRGSVISIWPMVILVWPICKLICNEKELMFG